VFQPGERPWIRLEGAEAARVAEVVMRCPTGALHFEPAHGAAREPVPAANSIQVSSAGPLYLRGKLRIESEAGETLLEDVRVALCRCGGSRNQPFCDGSHFRIGFDDRGEVFEGGMKPGEAAGPDLHIVPAERGPLRIRGPVTLRSADGRVQLEGGACSLCRCGGSRNKPFCDGTHNALLAREPAAG
jgi:CDGSH-type Zn-finger protein